jgi:predicted nucleic acid-binding protein
LIALSKLGRLALFCQLYKQVLIPQAVYEEVVVAGLREGHADAIVVDHFVQLEHILVRSVVLSGDDSSWAANIDLGEAEVIALARDSGADFAIIDNAHARRAARLVGVPVRGTVGMLLEAASKKQISILEFELLINEIKRRPEFWISPQLCDAALVQAQRQFARDISSDD